VVSRVDVQRSIEAISNLPTLPAVLTRVLDTVFDPNTSALELGELIAADQSLSANLLQIVNSAYYGFPKQISSITQAIVILGFVEVRNVAFAATAFDTITSDSSYDRVQLWRHSLATAMASERLVKALRIAVDGAFVMGLLHDFGKVALDALFPEQFSEAAREAHRQQRYVRDIEPDFFGIDHAEAGAILADLWNFPPGIVGPIRYHHRPDQTRNHVEETCLVAIADFLSYQAGLGESSNGREPEPPEFALSRLNVTEEQRQVVVENIRLSRDRIDGLIVPLAGKR
jgi:putative nucleotidyltransferase with HDIG domain